MEAVWDAVTHALKRQLRCRIPVVSNAYEVYYDLGSMHVSSLIRL